MAFSVNHPLLFIITGIIIVYVIFQSVFFLKKAWTRAGELGISRDVMKKVVKSSIAFTIAPAIAILIGLVTLANFLGLALPWLRLSVLGALTYELPAAGSVAKILKLPLDQPVSDPKVFIAIAWVMTLGILSGIFIIIFFQKKLQSGLDSMKAKDKKWSECLMDSLFIGMISAFLGMIFSDISIGIKGWIPVFVMMFSALLMMMQGVLIRKYKISWLENYALPFSMVGSMAFAVLISGIIS